MGGSFMVFEGDATADLVVDGNLITAKHPEITDQFMERFVQEIESNNHRGILTPSLHVGGGARENEPH